MDPFLLQSLILVLLPMIPAVILFKAFPSTGEGTGSFGGWQWKFGGAFAAYVLVFFMLWGAMRTHLQSRDAEVWVVRGNIAVPEVPDISNLVSIKSLPTMLEIQSDGSYEFRVIGMRNGNQLRLPVLIFDFSRFCVEPRRVRLDDDPGTFKTLPSSNSVKFKRSDADRSIEVETIALKPSDPKKCASDEGVKR